MFGRFGRSRDSETASSREEAQLRAAKLRVEIAILERQLSPEERRYERVKSLGGISGVITAAVALFALFLSAFQWLRSEGLNREVRTEERLERSLKMLGETTPTARLAGVVAHRFGQG